MNDITFLATDREDIEFLMDVFDLKTALYRYLDGDLSVPVLVWNIGVGTCSHQGLINYNGAKSWGTNGLYLDTLEKAILVKEYKKPEFKVGDWVRLNCLGYTVHQILKLTYDSLKNCYHPQLSNFNGNIDCEKSLELWQPHENEWCWFWGDNVVVPVFARFLNMHGNNYNGSGRLYGYCEPFIGQLPTILGDNKCQ